MRSDTLDQRRVLTAPGRLKWRHWWDVTKRVFLGIGEDNLSLIAAGCAFYAMLALAPALTALVLIYGLIADPIDVARSFEAIGGLMPGEVSSILQDQLERLTSTADSRLGWGLAVALGFALWTASAGVKAILSALNVAFREDEKRGIVSFNLIGLAFTIAAVLAFVIALGVIVGVPAMLAFVGLGPLAETALLVLRWPLLATLVIFSIAALYRYGPSRRGARVKWVTPGALIATALWIAVSIGFSLYVTEFASYNKTYGSLGAIVVMLFWLYLTAFVIILGAKINGEVEHQTAVDTTVGAPKNLGHRGAYVADHVAGVVNARGADRDDAK